MFIIVIENDITVVFNVMISHLKLYDGIYIKSSDDCNEYLQIQGSIVYECSRCSSGSFQTVSCDLMNCSMSLAISTNDRKGMDIINMDESKDSKIIDLDSEGMRWEGGSLFGKPFGYGRIYNDTNSLLYEGFYCNGKRVCYGKSYPDGVSNMEYEGTFFCNMRHGIGKVYDRKGNLIDECVYHLDKRVNTKLVINKSIHRLVPLYSCMKELIIGHHCQTEFNEQLTFSLVRCPLLQYISVGNNSFLYTSTVLIDDCNELRGIAIRNSSFEGCPDLICSLCICNCKKLRYIKCYKNSFSSYNCLELSSIL